jgi:hypothetical protein
VIDQERWARLAFHLHDVCTADDPDITRAELAAVRIYTAIHHRLEHPDHQI